MKKVLLTTVMSLMMCMGVFAQTQPDYMKAPKPNEKVIGIVNIDIGEVGETSAYSDQQVYGMLLNKAKEEFPNYIIDIRELQNEKTFWYYWENHGNRYKQNAVGKVVDLHNPESSNYENLSKAMDKALRNVREGSRLAIDQITVTSSMDREALKDQLLDVLLDKGYRVVAKDYLEKLYDEIKDQGSGIYNDKTTVKEDNFSAVGYYINVKVTETSLRVQVVNVSTGEYEGNATVNF